MGESSIQKIRERLRDASGPKYWRSLEEVSQTDDFKKLLKEEFPESSSLWEANLGRRDFMKLMGAGLAMAGLAGCARQPLEKIIPYVKSPEEMVPGKPLFFATAVPFAGFGKGVLVESHMGRPTRVEGNPLHPASLGAADIFGQAEALSLYDPDRSQTVKSGGRIRTWEAFLSALKEALASLKYGSRLKILTGPSTSPSVARAIRAITRKYPGAVWHRYAPFGGENETRGIRLAYGKAFALKHRLADADVILSLGSDFLGPGPASLPYIREFASRREVRPEQSMNRLYVAEASPTITGSAADHRLPLRSSLIPQAAVYLASQLGVVPSAPGPLAADEKKWLSAAAADLKKHAGKSIVIAGPSQPPALHALAAILNDRLGNTGKTVVYTAPVLPAPDSGESISRLAGELESDGVDILLIAGGNPAFDAPAGLKFAEAMKKARLKVRLGLYEDETSERSDWHIPETHFLEAWGDIRAYDGTVSIQQPLIAPLYGGRSLLELLALFAGEEGRTAHELVRETWKEMGPKDNFEQFWEKSVHDGWVEGTAFAALTPPAVRRDLRLENLAPIPLGFGEVELDIAPDPSIWDGSYADNGWLQELPKPVTKLTWDNAALVGPELAESLGLRSGDFVSLKTAQGELAIPIWITPGEARGSVTVHAGYGRSRSGRVAKGAGFNVYPVRAAPGVFTAKAGIRKTGVSYKFATTQKHHSMENRSLIRSAPLEEFLKHPDFAQTLEHGEEHTFYPDFVHDGNAWGMSINLSACVGCNACIVACQSENNIPVVGKEEVSRGREMHWIRVDQYFSQDLENPEIASQPVLCMHCEHAPCEPVCPVEATTHSEEGLNEMTYNRCVGTRYCSNNCPYKVRRFNFFQYSDEKTPSLMLGRNPDVTVRTRGVMEKCTYCVQRINAARIDSKKEGRAVRDGEVVTACQSSCPAGAIVFGNLHDPASRVSQLKKNPRNYGLLTELNTKPRTTYLAKIRNPNPALEVLP